MPDVTFANIPLVVRRDTCRSCEVTLESVLALGDFAINAFPAPDDPPPPVVPLELCWCPRCTLVQLRHTTPADLLFRTYYYRSGVNDQMRDALRDVLSDAVIHLHAAHEDLRREDWVVDIGANDGTLLREYVHARNVRYLKQLPHRAAWEPARNLYELVRPHADVLVNEYFPTDLEAVPAGTAKIITSIAMVYDLEDPHAFVEGVKQLLHRRGVWVVQFSDVWSMLRHNDFPTICHEHLEYYSLHSFKALIEAHGLTVVDVSENDVNGGSLRVFVQHHGRAVAWSALGDEILSREIPLRRALARGNPLMRFADQAARIRDQLATTVLRLREVADSPVDAYGASTKGNILLQYCALGPQEIRQVAERSGEKVGRCTVTGIPIVSELAWRKDPAPVTIVPIWPFRNGILEREAAYLAHGGQFIFPLPHVDVVRNRS